MPTLDEQKVMSEYNQELNLQEYLETELEKARETTSLLQDDREVSDQILHETFTL